MMHLDAGKQVSCCGGRHPGIEAGQTRRSGTSVAHSRLLGGEGMGMVQRVEDTSLGRTVAIKFLPETTAGDTGR